MVCIVNASYLDLSIGIIQGQLSEKKTQMLMKSLLSFLLAFFFLSSIQAQVRCIEGNCSTGYGTCVFSNGAKYVGEFKDGKLQGKGIFYYTDGNKYIGDWIDQRRSGKGRMIYTNGDEYFGQFQNNRVEGYGTMNYANGNKYVGNWKNDRPVGQGTYSFADGSRYEGTFANGVFHGQGTFYYQDGKKYVGLWQQGQKHGDGTMYTAAGQAIGGQWIKGQYQADWKSYSAQIDTLSLRDCNQYFCNNGKGKYRYADGTLYVGSFENGKPRGEGTVAYVNGNRYAGGWMEGLPNGRGVMFYSSGKIVGGIWTKGQLIEQLYTDEGTPFGTPVTIDRDEEVKIWAVVVGAASYTHMPPLRYTDDDAYQVFAFLKSPEGGALPDEQVNVLIDENATKGNILNSLRSIFLRADENDVLLFYFSGHGLKGAFLPVDYDGLDNQLFHEEIKDILRLSRAKHKLILADACHSGSLLSLKGPLQTILKKYYRAFEDVSGGTALLMSSKGEEYSLEDGGLRSGIFSHFLIRGLKGAADSDENKIVTIQELYDYVFSNVKEYTGNVQTPTLTGTFNQNMPVSIIR